jgi:cytoskeletal protein CcmA (bactofilin family)
MLQPNEKPQSQPAAPVAPSQFSIAKTFASAGTAEQATIGRSIVIKGEVSGGESLYIDGKIEGSINLPDHRVTVGRNGQVKADISAKEVVVMGKIDGNLVVGDRVDVRNEGSVNGDVVAQRLTVEDGAFINGRVDLGKGGKGEPKTMAAHA